MKSPRLLALLLAGTAAALVPAYTQQPAAPEPKASTPAAKPVFIFNVDFSGGTIAQLAQSIRPSGSQVFNVIGEKAELATEIPALSLRNVDAESLANALNRLVNPRGIEIMRAQGPVYAENANLPVYVVTRKQPPNTRSLFQSYQLAPYLGSQSIDDIVGAIRAAWELNPTHDRNALQLKFHPATGILLVAGPEESIQVTHAVIGALRVAEPKANNKPPPSEKK